MTQVNHHPWSWLQFTIALGMIPASAILWFIGLLGSFGPTPDPTARLCLISPFIGSAGAMWLVILVGRTISHLLARRAFFGFSICLIAGILACMFGLI